jgi:hypothetical protein
MLGLLLFSLVVAVEILRIFKLKITQEAGTTFIQASSRFKHTSSGMKNEKIKNVRLHSLEHSLQTRSRQQRSLFRN